MTSDHIVTFLREEKIRESALATRQFCRVAEKQYFDICKIIAEELIPNYKKKGQIKLKFFDRSSPSDSFARVVFGDPKDGPQRTTTLHVDRLTWHQAAEGDGFSRFVMAHEIGHLILHDFDAKAFSRTDQRVIKEFVKEMGAEWQANIFAGYFLLPDDEIEKILYTTPNDAMDIILEIYKVDERLAKERLAEFRKLNRIYEGEICPGCANFTLKRNGTLLKCSICGPIFGI